MRRHIPECPIQEPEIMAGPQICKACTAIRSARYQAFALVLDMLKTGCGDVGCGCDPVMTDCCDDPRWNCQTGIIFDSAGDPDVVVCRPGFGCHEAKRYEPVPFYPDPIPAPPF